MNHPTTHLYFIYVICYHHYKWLLSGIGLSFRLTYLKITTSSNMSILATNKTFIKILVSFSLVLITTFILWRFTKKFHSFILRLHYVLLRIHVLGKLLFLEIKLTFLVVRCLKLFYVMITSCLLAFFLYTNASNECKDVTFYMWCIVFWNSFQVGGNLSIIHKQPNRSNIDAFRLSSPIIIMKS